MAYKYKKFQLFGKKLNVPNSVRDRVYSCTATFYDAIKYNLEDKVPMTCFLEGDRNLIANLPSSIKTKIKYNEVSIVEFLKYKLEGKIEVSCLETNASKLVKKFGIEKLRALDWEMITENRLEETLLSIDANVPDLGKALSDRTFDLRSQKKSDFMNDHEIRFMSEFNVGRSSLHGILAYWDICKDKDFSHILEKEGESLSAEQIKYVMSKYSKVVNIIKKYSDVTELVNEVFNCNKNEQKEHEVIGSYAKKILEGTGIKDHPDMHNSNYSGFFYSVSCRVSNSEFEELLKYFPIEDYIKMKSPYSSEKDIKRIADEMKSLPEGFVADLPFPAHVLSSYSVVNFVSTYGLKNIAEFDKECGHFFSKNECKMLQLADDMYLHYSGHNKNNPKRSLFPRFNKSENIDENAPFTKDEFYEAVRRMILYGTSNGYYKDDVVKIEDMEGAFRERNKELFIAEEAPEALKSLFYGKKITAKDVAGLSPQEKEFLRGKSLECCMSGPYISTTVDGQHNYEILYNKMNDMFGFDMTMDFISEYADIIENMHNRDNANGILFDIREKFDNFETLEDLKNLYSEVFRVVILNKEDIVYPEKIPQDIRDKNEDLFLPEGASLELQELYYSKQLTASKIAELSKEEREFLRGKKLQSANKGFFIEQKDGYRSYSTKIYHLFDYMNEKLGFENSMKFIEEYGYLMDSLHLNGRMAGSIRNAFGYASSLEDFEAIYDKLFVEMIERTDTKYPEKVPQKIKDKRPEMFLSNDAPKELQEVFYNRELSAEFLEANPQFKDCFENTSLIMGLPAKFIFLREILKGKDIKEQNQNAFKIISAYEKINDESLQNIFVEFIRENINNFNLDNLSLTIEVLQRISYSNAKEIYAFRNQIAPKILEAADPLAKLKEIESVFLKKDMPMSGKIFASFELLSPDIASFNFSEHSRVSPTLKSHKSSASKKAIIFSDLLKVSLSSNNRSIKEYIDSLEHGNAIYESVVSGKVKFEDLKENEVAELLSFRDKILAVTKARFKKQNDGFSKTENVVEDIKKLGEIISPRADHDKNLADRVVQIFCGSVGITSIYQAKELLKTKIETVEKKNRESATSEFTIKPGDLIKGINRRFFGKILQTGSVSKEFLGESAGSDMTPLDTDLSMLTDTVDSVEDAIKSTAAKGYGDVWFVLKNDDRFVTTRDHYGVENASADKLDKIELFYTGVCDTDKSKHYGIRTGFGASDIDCIVVDGYTPEIGLEIAMNGFYIPVRDIKGELIFSPEQYDAIRGKMSGLKEYGCDEFKFSESLYTSEVEGIAAQIDKSQEVTEYKRSIINKVIEEALKELNLDLKTAIDGDLSNGIVELIDTGSTGRGTNKPGDGDFDFMMRIDRNILNNPQIMVAVKAKIMSKLGEEHASEVTGAGDFRLKDVELEDVKVDIDISFVEKTASTTYSTDMALKERLEQIKKQDPRAYKYVVANILFAKQVLKKAEAYKPNRGDVPQGGLGGVGIENWVLQHGGSFVDAAKSFLEAAEGRSFEEFKKVYQVWDFGENHFAERKGIYPHDNFVAGNMSEQGYEKMKQALLEYMKEYNKTYGIKTKGGE